MHLIGGLILAVLMVTGAASIARSIAGGLTRHVPAPARKKVGNAAKKGKHTAEKAHAAATDKVRHIFARAAADNWVAKKAHQREHRPLRPTRAETAGRAIRATGRAIGRGVKSIPRPTSVVSIPGVTHPTPAQARLRSVPDLPPPASTPARPAAQPPANRPPQPRQLSTARRLVMPAGTPVDHAAIASRIAAFEPESDAELLQFMSGEAAAMVAYSQAMEQLCEHLLHGIGLDPASVQAVNDFGQAQAEAAAIMLRAQARFQQVYQGVRESVAAGTVMPFSGRFITGEGA